MKIKKKAQQRGQSGGHCSCDLVFQSGQKASCSRGEKPPCSLVVREISIILAHVGIFIATKSPNCCSREHFWAHPIFFSVPWRQICQQVQRVGLLVKIKKWPTAKALGGARKREA